MNGPTLLSKLCLFLGFSLLGFIEISNGQNLVEEVIFTNNSGEIWKSSQTGTDFGTIWRQLGYDDSGWIDTPVKFYASHGTVPNDNRGYYFRKEFDVQNVEQIVSMYAEIYYDDAAVLFLNGQEVYRTIRNNLPTDPELSIYQSIPYGGAEDAYIAIPAESNYCERGCDDTSTDPIPVDLLVDGTNVFGIMAWTTPSSDLGVDLSLIFTRNLDIALEDISINEFVSSNDGILLDEDGDDPDWIEIHNYGTDPISLNSWKLSDLTNEWVFPDTTLAPGTYLVVFASDKDRAVSGSELHTNFKISKFGDALTLTNAEGYIVDDYKLTEILPQFENISWGRGSDNEMNIGYLASPTPGSSNSPLGSNYPPILRKFSDRIYNLGDSVVVAAEGFDPDQENVSYSMSPSVPGIMINSTTGEIIGKLNQEGVFSTVITITDSDNLSDTESVEWHVLEEPSGPASLVLNEYNAVAPARLLGLGEDDAFGPVLGNGGDWFEFLVVQDDLDLRGWSIEFWDRDNGDDLLNQTANLIFGSRPELAAIPAGTILTISEDIPDDSGFYPPEDWHINMQANEFADGSFFTAESQSKINSTRSGQTIIIRNAQGNLESPILGETDAWDHKRGGVSGGEVMANCASPSPSYTIDKLYDYNDTGLYSSFGMPNSCLNENDPNDPDDDEIEVQDLSQLRDSDGDGETDDSDLDSDGDGIPDLTEILQDVEIVDWTIDGNYLSTNDNNISMTSGSPGWQAQVISQKFSNYQILDDYEVTWTLHNIDGLYMHGLGITETTSSHTDIEFAFYKTSNSVIYRESGNGGNTLATVAAGDVLGFRVENQTLSYLVNGQALRTVNLNGTPDFYFDSSFHSGPADIRNFVIKPLGNAAISADPDGDGVQNNFDLDSDNDAIPDVIEVGLVDDDMDFRVDDINLQGTIESPIDTDQDGLPDYLDLESSNPLNDGTSFDISTTAFASLDSNGDGFLDANDIDGGVDVNNNGVDDLVEDLMVLGTEPPTISIVDPIAGATFEPGVPFTITLDITDPDIGYSIDSARVSVGSYKFPTLTNGPPWTISASLPPGKYDLEAEAWDNIALRGVVESTTRVTVASPNACDGAQDIVINEVNYNDAAGFQVGDWIELYNPNLSPIDLENWVIKDSDQGNWYVFPEGSAIFGKGFVVVAQDTAQFAGGYGDISTDVFGPTVWGLSNSIDQINLYNPNGCRVDKVQYADDSPWPSEPDGEGPTLELTDPSLDNLNVSSWQASTTDGGTPGASNSGLPSTDGPGLLLRLEVLLAGAFQNNDMRTSLNSADLLPLEQPYSLVNPALITQSFKNNHPEIVDWVWIELRSNIQASTAQARFAVPLTKTGFLIDPQSGQTSLRIKGVPEGDYYVVVNHRNHLSVMSAVKITLSQSSLNVLDFTGDQSAVYTAGQAPQIELSNGVYGMYAGDLNGDNKIVFSGGNNDRVRILDVAGGPTAFDFATGYLREDITLDGKVSYSGAGNDRVILLDSAGGPTAFDFVVGQVPQ